MERASKRLIASDRSCSPVVVLKQTDCEYKINSASRCLETLFECLKNLPALLRQERPCQPSSVTSFPHTQLCRSHIFEPNRSAIAILSCWFDSFSLKFLHGMTFNHWEPNLSWNALNLLTSVGSSRNIKSAISLSKIGSVQCFRISFSGAFQFFQVQTTI